MSDEQQKEQPSLTPKQLLFVAYYLESGNATRAAERAGYAHPNMAGPRMMVNDGVRAEIDRRMTEIMPKAEILARLADIGRNSNLENFFTIGEEDVVIDTITTVEEIEVEPAEGRRRKPNVKVTVLRRSESTVTAKRPIVMLDLRAAKEAGVLHHIKKFSSGRDGDRIEVHDSQAALVQLGKFHGMWVEKQQVENWDMSGFTLPELDRIAAGESPADVIKDRGKA